MNAIRLGSLGTVCALILIGSTATANAQILVPYGPPVNWSGPYLGFEGGGGWGSSRQSDSTGFDSASFQNDGALLGVTGGYNWQSGPIVFGAEGDLSWADFRGSTIGLPGEVCGGVPSNCHARLGDLGTVRGRLGYTVGTLMPYATAGLAFGDLHGREGDVPANGATGFGDAYRLGWTVGAGIEGAIAPRWSAKLEYLHVDLGNGPVFTDTFSNGATVTQHVGFQADVIRVGVNYRF